MTENPYKSAFVTPGVGNSGNRILLISPILLIASGVLGTVAVHPFRVLLHFDELFLWTPGVLLIISFCISRDRIRGIVQTVIAMISALYFLAFSISNFADYANFRVDAFRVLAEFKANNFTQAIGLFVRWMWPLHFLGWVVIGVRSDLRRRKRSKEEKSNGSGSDLMGQG